jgi:hypothetical protein
MTDHISPEFHAELIVEFFNDYRDLRKVREKARLLLSRASTLTPSLFAVTAMITATLLFAL